jgi:hypothetical protein
METLTATTPVGAFARKTSANYTHVVVWKATRAARDGELSGNSVWNKCHNQNGHHVTWHTTKALAEKTASKPFGYDWNAALVGVFPVDIE